MFATLKNSACNCISTHYKFFVFLSLQNTITFKALKLAALIKGILNLKFKILNPLKCLLGSYGCKKSKGMFRFLMYVYMYCFSLSTLANASAVCGSCMCDAIFFLFFFCYCSLIFGYTAGVCCMNIECYRPKIYCISFTHIHT